MSFLLHLGCAYLKSSVVAPRVRGCTCSHYQILTNDILTTPPPCHLGLDEKLQSSVPQSKGFQALVCWWWHRFWGPVTLFPVLLKWCCEDGDLFASGWGLVGIMGSYPGLFALRVDTSFAIAEWSGSHKQLQDWLWNEQVTTRPDVGSLLVLATSNLGLDSWIFLPNVFCKARLSLDLLIRLGTSLALFCLLQPCFDSLLVSWQSRLVPSLVLASNTSLGVGCFILPLLAIGLEKKGSTGQWFTWGFLCKVGIELGLEVWVTCQQVEGVREVSPNRRKTSEAVQQVS